MTRIIAMDSTVCSGSNCIIRTNCERYEKFWKIRRRYAGREYRIPGAFLFMSPIYDSATYTCKMQVKIRKPK